MPTALTSHSLARITKSASSDRPGPVRAAAPPPQPLRTTLPAAPAAIPVHPGNSYASAAGSPGRPGELESTLLPEPHWRVAYFPLLPKLSVGASNDPLEREADHVAERVLRMGDHSATPKDCGCGGSCPDCRKPEIVRAFSASPSLRTAQPAPYGVDRVLRSPGEPLGQSARDFFEPRFGVNFSGIRVHLDGAAAESAREIRARAYTVGTHIVFGKGEYSPDAPTARGLLAHELAHVLQQNFGALPNQLQCKGAPDANAAIKVNIRKSATYRAEAVLTEQIIKAIDKKPEADRPDLFQSLFDALNTAKKPPEKIAEETNESTEAAVAQEQVRLSKPKQVEHTRIEEEQSADPARKDAWEPVKGKFGGGTYYIDRRSATDIQIKAKIFLHAAGTGTDKEVKEVEAMEDAIEKSASTFGYSVDIIFVDTKEKDAFDVTVDPSQWEVATNWAGGSPAGYAHELHHLLAFELDKYNYIQNQSTNDSMKVHDRLIWFQKELGKPADFNDPTSIMSEAPYHPNESDVCITAGLDPQTCQQERHDARKVRDRLLDAINRSDGTDIFVATEMVPDSLRGPMLGDADVLAAIDTLPAKARLIIRMRLQFGGNKIPAKVRELSDAAVKMDAGKVLGLLKNSPGLHGPFASPAENLKGILSDIADIFVADLPTRNKVKAAAAT